MGGFGGGGEAQGGLLPVRTAMAASCPLSPAPHHCHPLPLPVPYNTAAADVYRSKYGYFDLYFGDSAAGALAYDVLPSSHPLSAVDPSPISSLPDIDNMFDSISYEKVCARARTRWGCTVYRRIARVMMS